MYKFVGFLVAVCCWGQGRPASAELIEFPSAVATLLTAVWPSATSPLVAV